MTSDVRAERRHELGAYLRARRERTTPSAVGLPSTGRRRTPGLRREELAALAGISTTWYTFLEQGRDVRPSRQVLDAIADALGLDRPERDYLIAIAGDDTPSHADPEFVAPEVAGVPGLLDPNPAYLTGGSYDLLGWNRAAEELLPGACAGPAPNLARWIFTRPEARAVLPDWAEVAQGVLARLRANAGRQPGSPRFARIEAELRSASTEADTWWTRYDIATSRAGVKRVRSTVGAVRELSYASFQVADRTDQVLTVYRFL